MKSEKLFLLFLGRFPFPERSFKELSALGSIWTVLEKVQQEKRYMIVSIGVDLDLWTALFLLKIIINQILKIKPWYKKQYH